MESNHVAALQQRSPIKATLVRFDLPGAPLCLTDGGFSVFDAGKISLIQRAAAAKPTSRAFFPTLKVGVQNGTLVILPEKLI